MSGPVIPTIEDEIAALTLKRPRKLDAVNDETIDRAMASRDQIESSPDMRAVTLTGAGERAVSAGGDIRKFSVTVSKGTSVALREFVRRGQTRTVRRELFPSRSSPPSTASPSAEAARSPKRPFSPSRATALSSLSLRSSLACRRLSAAPSACRVWPAERERGREFTVKAIVSLGCDRNWASSSAPQFDLAARGRQEGLRNEGAHTR